MLRSRFGAMMEQIVLKLKGVACLDLETLEVFASNHPTIILKEYLGKQKNLCARHQTPGSRLDTLLKNSKPSS